MKTITQKTITQIIVLSLLLPLFGCSTNLARKNNKLGPQVPIPVPVTPAALLELEKQHAIHDRTATFKGYRKSLFESGQYVFSATRKPYVLGFARQYAASHPDWSRVTNNVLDVANIGMHLFSSGPTLGPLWLTLVDIDSHIIEKSKEGKTMHMPSLTIYAPYPDLNRLPVDEALAEGTRRLGEQLVSTELCHYHTYPRVGAYGRFIPGIIHQRALMCGRPNPTVPSAAEFGNAWIETLVLDEKNPLSQLFGVGTVVSTFLWLPEWTNYPMEIQQAFYDYVWEGPEFTAAVDGFKVLKTVMPDDAYTVITGPDGEGNWRVFVAHQDVMVAYPPPWATIKKPPEQAAQKDLRL
ncbi:hypothetical protein [Thiolapillus sp.]|nr:hypothetical protein [Thiolapillus sp.]